MSAGDFIPAQPLPSINKPQLILGAFGLGLLKPKFYKSSDADTFNDKLRPTNNKGVLGLPVFGGIVFKTTSYKNKYNETITLQDLFIDCCLIEVGIQRNIIKTDIQGRDSSVKQFISNGDHSIVIRGILAGNGQQVYPDFEMRKLTAICKSEVSVDITCPFLQDYFKVNSLVVTYASFPQKEGNITIQPFELQCLSDEPFELKLKSDATS